MAIKDRITEDLKTAMKAKDKDRLSVLRMILSEIKYAQAAVNVHQDLPEADVLKVVATYQKRLTKSLDDYPEGEKRTQIQTEIAIVDDYLPKKVGPDEVKKAIDEVLLATSERAFGPLMKEVLARLGSGGDGKVVSQLLKDKLASL
ncbi:MAG: GatB/YqeY domain-containing protein [Proteobacteria bacterium]|nr:GatB/YqeY domain-containing protein [Pseudomonadota bacterium]